MIEDYITIIEQLLELIDDIGSISINKAGDSVWDIYTGRTDIIDTAEEAVASFMPVCDRCNSSKQVWKNQITGKITCHRWGCNNRELQEGSI